MGVRPILFIPALLLLCSCGGTYLPDGDAEEGRVAFQELGCHACHRVHGESFPEPVATPPVPVVLGSPSKKLSRLYLAESIIAPSHRFAKKRPSYVVYRNIREGAESRMGDYNDVLTVREWLNLVAFLEAAQNDRSRTP